MPAPRGNVLLALAAALTLVGSLSAQDAPLADPRAVQPERPTVATHAHTVAAGYLEIETGVEGDAANGTRVYFAPTVFKVGLASHLQLNVSTPVVFAGPGQSTGFGDAGVGLKWRLLDDNRVLGDFAVLPFIKFPTGSNDLGTGSGTTDVGVLAIASYDLGGVAMDLNLGYTRIGSRDASAGRDAALWTASFGFPIIGALSWNAELFGFPTIDGSRDPSAIAFLTGPGLLVNRALNLDIGFITPLAGRQPNAIYAGLVWNAGALISRPAGEARGR